MLEISEPRNLYFRGNTASLDFSYLDCSSTRIAYVIDAPIQILIGTAVASAADTSAFASVTVMLMVFLSLRKLLHPWKFL